MRLECLVTEVPHGRLDVDTIIRDASGDPAESASFQALFGMRTVALAERRETPLHAFDRLVEDLGPIAQAARPDAVFYVHAQPAVPCDALGDAGALRRRHRLLADVRFLAEIDQHNCAGSFYALQAAEHLMDQGYIKTAMVFAGDSLADWEPRYRYVPSCTVLGDAFVALLVSNRAGGLQFDRIHTRHHPRFAAGLDADGEAMREFNRCHLSLIDQALAPTGFLADPDAMLFPHNINGLCWKLFSRRYGIEPARMQVGLVAEIGHCCTTDPFLVLGRYLAEEDPRDLAGSVLSIGMGGFTGAARITMGSEH